MPETQTAPKQEKTFLARLKRFDPRKGHIVQRYTYRGRRFVANRGWYRVDEATAEYLRTVHQHANDEDSPLAFDVHTEDEAREIDAAERAAEEERRNATNPIDARRPERSMRRARDKE